MRTMRKTPMLLALFGLALAAWVVLPGCGGENDLVTSPSASQWASGDPASFSPPEGGLTDRRIVGGTHFATWTLVASGWVTPEASVKVEGSRYSLKFPKGGVAKREFITICERDPMVADVEFGPHGTWFVIPVEVTIDYKGTSNDPESKNYNGMEPAVFWYDPVARAWQPIPFTADKNLKKVTFYLEHFSRYALQGATDDGEWQWTRTGKQTEDPLGEGPSDLN